MLIYKVYNFSLISVFPGYFSITNAIKLLQPLKQEVNLAILIDLALHIFDFLQERNMPIRLITLT